MLTGSARLYSTKGSTSAPSEPCIASWGPTTRCGTAGTSARAYCHAFFPWYNTKHRYSGLGLLTPHDVHHGLADQRVAAVVLATAHAAGPERFHSGLPQPPARSTEVWINPPATGSTEIAPDGSQDRSYAEAHDLEPERRA